MPIADQKKVQVAVNIIGREVQNIRDAVNRLNALKTKFITHNPDVTGTVLEGRTGKLNALITNLDAEVNNNADFDALIAEISPSHPENLLD